MTNHTLNQESSVPDVVFKTRVRDESIGGENPFRWQDITSKEIFEGKKSYSSGLPGAFTPTCSSKHVPGYEEHYDKFKNLIRRRDLPAVNDAFVMYQWAKNLGVKT